jgi:hypothetical protein
MYHIESVANKLKIIEKPFFIRKSLKCSFCLVRLEAAEKAIRTRQTFSPEKQKYQVLYFYVCFHLYLLLILCIAVIYCSLSCALVCWITG